MEQAGVDFTEERLEAFPTRIFRRRYEGLGAFNRRMAEIILEHEAASDGGGLRRSNVGGWHSENDLLRWDHPEIQVLVGLIQSTVMEYVGLEAEKDPRAFELKLAMEAWANVTRAGHYSKPHVHPMANFALVYYVDIGNHEHSGPHDSSGCIEFIDPRNRVAMLSTPGIDTRDSLRMRPQSSVMLIFPAWMYHYVHPYAGSRPRITIAINATIQALTDKPAAAPDVRPKAAIIEAD